MPPHKRSLFTSRLESEIAPLLAESAARTPGVVIGSYPQEVRGRTWVEIVLTAPDESLLEAAAAWLAERLPGQPAA